MVLAMVHLENAGLDQACSLQLVAVVQIGLTQTGFVVLKWAIVPVLYSGVAVV